MGEPDKIDNIQKLKYSKKKRQNKYFGKIVSHATPAVETLNMMSPSSSQTFYYSMIYNSLMLKTSANF